MKTLLVAWLCCLLVSHCRHAEPDPPPADETLHRQLQGGRMAFARRQPAQAAQLYQQALERARVIDLPLKIGNAAYNLGVVLVALGDYEAADIRLREAQSALSRAGENLADVLVVRARLAVLDHRPADASELGKAVLSHPQSQPDVTHLVQTLSVLGMAAVYQDKFADAEKYLSEANALMPSDANVSLRAMVKSLEGTIYRETSQPEQAAQSFDAEARLWRASGLYHEMASALGRAGKSWLAAGHLDRAADRLYRAARSFAGQAMPESAMKLLQEARAASERGKNARLLDLIEELERELR